MPSRLCAGLNRPGQITLRAGTAEHEGKPWVVVDVIDDGPGVPEAFLDRVFEPFFTTRDDGTGYGLYLAAELLKEQSGRISVRNKATAERRSRSGFRGRIGRPSGERRTRRGLGTTPSRRISWSSPFV